MLPLICLRRLCQRGSASAAVLLCCLLAACTTPITQPDTGAGAGTGPLLQQAENALNNEKPLLAGQRYEQLAAQSNSPEREQYLLAAIEAYLAADAVERAAELALRLRNTPLPPQQGRDIQFLVTSILLKQGKAEQALNTLDRLVVSELPRADRIRYYQLRADAFFQAGNLLESAQQRVTLDDLLVDDELRLANQSAILDTLMLLSDQALERLKPPPPNPMAGWMDLARLLKTNPVDSVSAPSIIAWRETNPFHSANADLLEQLILQQETTPTTVSTLAVFLPESGPFANAAKAVRQGIASATLSDRSMAHTRIRFYDTEAEAIENLYQRAIIDGAEGIIGPLDKNQVSRLASVMNETLPVLALNQINGATPAQLYQFGLSPEQEAEQVAALAWSNGHQNALILTQQSSYGQRIARHFAQVWSGFGGRVLDVQGYRVEDADHSIAIRNLLNLDSSKARHQALVNRLNLKIEFEERRRQDVDFIFMVATPASARALKPQLRFHRASKLPVYGTSTLYSGQPNAALDIDLNGIRFCDMPWLIDPNDVGTLNTQRLSSLWPNLATPFKRLFSLGSDAVQLLPQLNKLASTPVSRIRGNSGLLYLNPQRQVQRQLSCAQFKRGLPQATGLAPQPIAQSLRFVEPEPTAPPSELDSVTTPLPNPDLDRKSQ